MFLRNRLHSLRNLARFSTIQTTRPGAVEARVPLQFTKRNLSEFGELPFGDIPEALKYDRPTGIKINLIKQAVTTLDNGVRVASEYFLSPLSSITVSVNAGSRYETLETSGASNFISKLILRGTESKTREQIDDEIDSLGGNFHVKLGREIQTYTISFEPQNLDRAVNLLGEILGKSLFCAAQIEAEKEAIYKEQVSMDDQARVITEAAHYTNYRDHFIGQPVLGIRENVPNINEEILKAHHKTHFVGPNIIVAGAGPINHENLAKVASSAFGQFSSQAPTHVNNAEKPFATHSIINMRDDELTNANVGVFFNAPSWSDPDFLPVYFFGKILGDYRADRYTGAHLNTTQRQYNQIHMFLGDLPDVQIQKAFYFPYSDTAIFGNYFVGNEVYLHQMAVLSQMILSEYASFINAAEVFRARAKVFNELLSQANSAKVSKDVATQVQYWGRRMPRSEFARRISALEPGLLNRVAQRNFWDKDLSVVLWGPTHLLDESAHYNRYWKRSTLGTFAMMYYDQ